MTTNVSESLRPDVALPSPGRTALQRLSIAMASDRVYWAALPVLAFVAYFFVLRVGFLGDDFIFLDTARDRGIDLEVLLPGQRWFFYRPVGGLFTWELGWQLWGYNPFPYHLIQVLLHAAT